MTEIINEIELYEDTVEGLAKLLDITIEEAEKYIDIEFMNYVIKRMAYAQNDCISDLYHKIKMIDRFINQGEEK